jgi:outer membrane cobalamin receptor
VLRNGYFHPAVPEVAAGLLLALALTGVVQAQTLNPTQPLIPPTAGTGIENQGQLQTVIVTGYVVPRTGEGTQPVATIDQTFIENQGDQTVSYVIQKLPQNIGAFTQLMNAGASSSPRGSATNLYGLGTSSTLVLIDGFRQAGEGGGQALTNTNNTHIACFKT